MSDAKGRKEALSIYEEGCRGGKESRQEERQEDDQEEEEVLDESCICVLSAVSVSRRVRQG